MKIKISYNNEETKIFVSFRKNNKVEKKIEISEQETSNWNAKNINDFLAELAFSTNSKEKEKLIVSCESSLKPESKIFATYNHICELFKTFANKHNELIDSEEIY